MTGSQQKHDFIWWKHGVVYHIYPRSFYDSNNDGIGDLRGIIEKIDYLTELGVDAVWLSPIYKSPKVDNGYDVADYRQIDPDYGSMDDFKELLSLCHSKGIRLIMDMILNHTSDQHPWFLNSRSSKDSQKRDYYIWKKKKPNNWKSAFGKSGWSNDPLTKEYYYHSFFPEQPDLNWRNPKLQKAMFEEIQFWLDLGVDGFRLDVINFIVKDEKFRKDPTIIRQLLGKAKVYSRNRKESVKIVTKLRKLIDGHKDRAIIGEIYVLPPGDPRMVSKYLGKKKDALNLAFDFSLIFTQWSARKYYQTIRKQYKHLNEGAWATILFSNHDLKRSYSRPWNKRTRLPKAKLKAILMFSFKGTAFIYYGEEIGMEDTKLSRNEIQDKLGKQFWPLYKGRDGARTPMQWNDEVNSGFSSNKPWLPVNSNYPSVNVRSQLSENDSLLNLYQYLIRIRRKYKVLQKGEIELLSYRNNVLVYRRFLKDEQMFIFLNFSAFSKTINMYNNRHVLYLTHEHPKIKQSGEKLRLRPFEGVILHDFEGFNSPGVHSCIF